MTTESRKRSNDTEDFKRDAVALVTEQGYKISEAARHLKEPVPNPCRLPGHPQLLIENLKPNLTLHGAQQPQAGSEHRLPASS